MVYFDFNWRNDSKKSFLKSILENRTINNYISIIQHAAFSEQWAMDITRSAFSIIYCYDHILFGIERKKNILTQDVCGIKNKY